MAFETFNQSITVHRHTAGTKVNGDWVPGAPIVPDPVIQGSVQPASSEDMLTLPANRRRSAAYLVFTKQELFTANKVTQINADRVVLFGEEYEISKVSKWQNNLISHYECLAVLILE